MIIPPPEKSMRLYKSAVFSFIYTCTNTTSKNKKYAQKALRFPFENLGQFHRFGLKKLTNGEKTHLKNSINSLMLFRTEHIFSEHIFSRLHAGIIFIQYAFYEMRPLPVVSIEQKQEIRSSASGAESKLLNNKPSHGADQKSCASKHEKL